MTPRRCDALPSVNTSTDPVEGMTEAAGYDLATSDGWTPPAPLRLAIRTCYQNGVSPSAAPLDVGRVGGSECKSGNVAGQCGSMLGGCERALSLGAGSVVWWPVLEVQ